MGLTYIEIKIVLAEIIFILVYEIIFAKKTSKFVKVCQGKLLECLLYQKLENLGIKVRI